MTEAGAYLRISYVREDGKVKTLGVERQLPPTLELVQRKDWRLAALAAGMTADEMVTAIRHGKQLPGVYCDNDISAYSRKKRPEYERLLADVAAGRIQAIAAWHPDRLTRQPSENERLIDIAHDHGVQFATAKVGEHDLATPAGRLNFRMLGVLARYESEHMAERRMLMLDQRAKAGLPHFGGQRPFGYQPGGMEVDEDEAALIVEAADRLLRKGESVYAVLADWDERGIRTPGTKQRPEGTSWSASPFRDMICSPRLAGLRQHHGEVIGPAAWPAILTVDDHEGLLRFFGAKPKRPGRPPNRLLVGVIFCGRDGCGCGLVSSWPSDIPGRWAYGCKRSTSRDGCGRTFIDGRQTDTLIVERIIDRLISGGLANAVKTAASDDAALRAAEQRRANADRQLDEATHARYVTAELGHKRYLAVKAELEAIMAEAERLLRARPDIAPLLELPRTERALRRWWASPKTTLEAKRNVVRAVLARVEVRPRASRRAHFDPDRLVIPEDGWRV